MVAFYEASSQRYRAQVEQAALQRSHRQPKRSAFYKVIEAAIGSCQQSQTPFTLIYIDIDNFKPINDEWRYGAGDQVLEAFAGRLRSSVRAQVLWRRIRYLGAGHR
ncbi:MAG: diguanylate cyclase (GGDEF)-like protein [Bacteroidia bacterium]|jgi:diguanylate cyclase (GGDEF)-like protein